MQGSSVHFQHCGGTTSLWKQQSRHARPHKCIQAAVPDVRACSAWHGPALCSGKPAWPGLRRVQRVRQQTPRAVSFEGAIPEGVQVEVKGPDGGTDVEWDADTRTLKLPINVVEGSGERRTKLVIFTCNKCGGRTARNVNPIAWERGMVMGQCATCEVWHVLSAKNKKIYEEIRYNESPDSGASGTSQSSSLTVMQQADEDTASSPDTQL